jgi:hypothetical protein
MVSTHSHGVAPDGCQGLNQWRGAIITPDGRTVLGIEGLAGNNLNGPIREHLVSWSAATGQQFAVLNNLNARNLGDYEQVLYTSADGSVLVLTYQQPGAKAAIVHDGRPAPIPWSPHIGAAGRHVGGQDVVRVAVQVVAGPLCRIVVRGSAWRAAIWTSRRSTPASSMVVTKVCRSICGCALDIWMPAA